MIYQEIVVINKRELLKTYSDTYYIKQKETGAVYEAAIDEIPCRYHYAEIDEKLPVEEFIEEDPEDFFFRTRKTVVEDSDDDFDYSAILESLGDIV